MTTPSSPDSPADRTSATATETSCSPWWPWALALTCALLAFAVRIGHEPLWIDETYSLAIVQHGFADLLRLVTGDVHPPLYYLLLKLSTLALGESAVALRLASALAATGLVALGAGPVRRLWGNRSGWVFAALVLSSSGLLSFAQEARMYTFAALFVTGAALYGRLALRDGKHADLVAFGLFTWAASLTHYFALVAVGMNAILLLTTAFFGERKRLRPLTATTGLAGLGFLPWAPFFWGQLMHVTRGFWIPTPSPELLVFGLVSPFAYKFEDTPYPWQAPVALGCAAVVLATTLAVKRVRGDRGKWAAQLQLLLIFLLTLGFGVGFSLLVRPIFMPRYMIVCAGVLLVAVAAGIARLPVRSGALVTMLFVLLGLPAWLRVQTQTFNGPFAHLAAEVERAGAPAPVLVHNAVPFSFALLPAAHATPAVRNVVLVPNGTEFDPSAGGVYGAGWGETVTSLDQLTDTSERIWIVNAVPGPQPLNATEWATRSRWVQQGEELMLEEPMSWVKLNVRRYERAAAGRSAQQEPSDER